MIVRRRWTSRPRKNGTAKEALEIQAIGLPRGDVPCGAGFQGALLGEGMMLGMTGLGDEMVNYEQNFFCFLNQ
jgi:hypothetical protein